ncbi:MAG: YukJ family protein, partial [Chloroflexota bacterium]|nr:YukJ family protein [Chloroflexota bacterium]
MPLRNYGVLKGRVAEFRPEVRGETPHFQILLDAGQPFRVSIGVRSGTAEEHESNLLTLIDPDVRHPVVGGLAELDDGFARLPSRPGGLALDYVRGGLFDPRRMRPLPPDRAGPENDVTDALARLARAALADERIRLYAFGDRWGPEPGEPDDVFGFEPGNGFHDLHMNQGNRDRHAPDNGPWQDG